MRCAHLNAIPDAVGASTRRATYPRARATRAAPRRRKSVHMHRAIHPPKPKPSRAWPLTIWAGGDRMGRPGPRAQPTGRVGRQQHTTFWACALVTWNITALPTPEVVDNAAWHSEECRHEPPSPTISSRDLVYHRRRFNAASSPLTSNWSTSTRHESSFQGRCGGRLCGDLVGSSRRFVSAAERWTLVNSFRHGCSRLEYTDDAVVRQAIFHTISAAGMHGSCARMGRTHMQSAFTQTPARGTKRSTDASLSYSPSTPARAGAVLRRLAALALARAPLWSDKAAGRRRRVPLPWGLGATLSWVWGRR